VSKRGERSIRFGITDGSGKRAATWKCWTPIGVGKFDVYLTCRTIGYAIKVSMHQTGEWHIAYSKEFFDENPEALGGRPQGRFIGNWLCPSEVAAGLKPAIRIITPHSAVNTPIASTTKEISWIPAPPPDQAIEIDIFITLPNALVSSQLGKNTMHIKPFVSLLLDNGGKISVTYKTIDCPKFPDIRGTPRYYKGKSRDDLTGNGLRIIIHNFRKEDGSLVIIDGAIAPPNS
jgi:hypothetical protein